MKKLIALALLFTIGTTTFAQDFGVKVGANFSNFSDASGFSNKTGFHAGIFGGFNFTDNVGLQADLLYSQQGAKFSRTEFQIDYVNIPVVVKFYLFKGFNLQVGPQFGFVVDDNITKLGGSLANSEVEKSDISGVFGAGLNIDSFRIDARYNFGLTHVIEGAKSKNSVYSIALGYSFL